ncbi:MULTISPECIES: hydroxymethylglutaryl-CoA lyase [unclassified Modestobacter]|uniref:hydroxymethylglutaryl-CoA lyase n=1 Tax=unclassified Modestobacter TaxID=2643866 RepID=UPI0022AA5080|nr:MULTISPECIES: hydroxymethylglutaryl-CoA lyase [unclassified Modestobacter]MCZ2826103.1 hydroxymethylglutaryl-CoA lyase [Modestobacter sp. VKM Ac-2981]MCZ2852832.1 hydroxymethylglutaryl-CoA lyase [Modestobacter sp. VKM Ac-2982]
MGGLPFDLPASVRIQEVGPRDGFQLEPAVIGTADKINIIDALAATGIPALQLTSFVRPDAVPQLSDAADVMAGCTKVPGVEYSVLVPNLKGAQRAMECDADVWELMLSSTDAHSIANANRPTEAAFELLRPAIELGLANDVRLVGAMATSLGCPFEGRTGFDRVAWVTGLYADAGVGHVTLADTAGLADPAYVYDMCRRLADAFPQTTITLHLHNTRGLGMANVLAGLAAGVTHYDSSIGGLGGCPYAPGATGNIATEELVHLLSLLGVDTGVDLDALIRIARGPVRAAVGHPLESSFGKADPSWVLHDPPAQQVLPQPAGT